MKKLLLLSFFLLFYASFKAQNNPVRNVDASTFQKLIESKKYVLIDLRTSDEIKTKGMIKGAIQLDYLAKDSEKQIGQLDHKKPYLIYCAGGGRSSECAELMQKLGFTEVVNLEKGYDDWKRKGLETVKN
ncbi:MAG: rhodanese-like domain-containing protein [Bacteroidia bacterium]|nr:rhodanese-like domain-containing protein [Bacteroidia bacterium]